MATYALWNNKGGVGKSYLTFQIACEYARNHPEKRVLVVDLCPQANASGMLLGGIERGEVELEQLSGRAPRRTTISGYIEDRIVSPYVDPSTGSSFVIQVCQTNTNVPTNLFLVAGDEQLEIQASRVLGATNPGPADAWRVVHTWIADLVKDIRLSWNNADTTVFIDCNPSFSVYTELAMTAADRLIIPFSADGSSKRAVRAVLALLYGITRQRGAQQSEFFLRAQQFRMQLPKIYCYIGNRMTQYVSSATAFRAVVTEIGQEIWNVWQSQPNNFYIHPNGAPVPTKQKEFARMFQYEVPDANTASVVSSSLGIPIVSLTAGMKMVLKKHVKVNQSQLDTQQPAIKALVAEIE